LQSNSTDKETHKAGEDFFTTNERLGSFEEPSWNSSTLEEIMWRTQDNERIIFLGELTAQFSVSPATVFKLPLSQSHEIQQEARALGFKSRFLFDSDPDASHGWMILGMDERAVQGLFREVAEDDGNLGPNRRRKGGIDTGELRGGTEALHGGRQSRNMEEKFSEGELVGEVSEKTNKDDVQKIAAENHRDGIAYAEGALIGAVATLTGLAFLTVASEIGSGGISIP
jgi:hypothetical protein